MLATKSLTNSLHLTTISFFTSVKCSNAVPQKKMYSERCQIASRKNN